MEDQHGPPHSSVIDRPAALVGDQDLTPWRNRADRNIITMMFLVAVVLAFKAFVDTDLPGHLAYGLDHLATGRLARTDPYSYTAQGAPWINHEWAFELLIAVVYSVSGTVGLLLLQAVAWTATGALTLRLAMRQTNDARAAAILFLSYLALSYSSVSIRPQLFTYLAFALLLTLMDAAYRKPLILLWAVPLMGLWVNFHGGFLAGYGVLGAYAAGLGIDVMRGKATPAHAKIAVLVTALAGVATLLNPYGLELHRWLLWSLVEPNQNVTEWQPAGLNDAGVILALAVVLAAAAFWRSGLRAQRLAYLLPLAATAWLSFQHTRHMPFFVMLVCAAVPLTAILPTRAAPSLTRKQHRRLQVLMAGIVINTVALRIGFGLSLKIETDPQIAWPTGAIQYVDSLIVANRSAPPRQALIPFDWAQLAIWRWYPHVRVHYDGRHRTVYPLEVEQEHWRFLGLEEGEWTGALADADLVMVRAGRPSDATMGRMPSWGLAYRDSIAAVYLRDWQGETTYGSPPESLPFDTRLSSSLK